MKSLKSLISPCALNTPHRLCNNTVIILSSGVIMAQLWKSVRADSTIQEQTLNLNKDLYWTGTPGFVIPDKLE